MNGLKWLIALTCVVVIGGVGYFTVSDINAKKADEAREARAQKSIECEDRVQAMENGKFSGDDLWVLTECTINGAMTQDRYNSAVTAAARHSKGG
ncbi:hypothetical protein HJA76_15015 [Rhizobium bangladeshense]|uniref:hypothetical protein n=1 Tax=Rhizobium bangladeshense TaxID=1138189 RepID=UPI001C83A084|nr:hypothetical protein [Rhizobium bangladeshense]MBX4921001.1 hypothetical protein [Rhizobium bangladeshense]